LRAVRKDRNRIDLSIGGCGLIHNFGENLCGGIVQAVKSDGYVGIGGRGDDILVGQVSIDEDDIPGGGRTEHSGFERFAGKPGAFKAAQDFSVTDGLAASFFEEAILFGIYPEHNSHNKNS